MSSFLAAKGGSKKAREVSLSRIISVTPRWTPFYRGRDQRIKRRCPPLLAEARTELSARQSCYARRLAMLRSLSLSNAGNARRLAMFRGSLAPMLIMHVPGRKMAA